MRRAVTRYAVAMFTIATTPLTTSPYLCALRSLTQCSGIRPDFMSSLLHGWRIKIEGKGKPKLDT